MYASWVCETTWQLHKIFIQFFGLVAAINELLEIGHEYSYRLCMKYNLHMNNYKYYGNSMKLWGYYI